MQMSLKDRLLQDVAERPAEKIEPADKMKGKYNEGRREIFVRSYVSDLDKSFFGTSYEVYNVSKKVKRKGGSIEIGGLPAFCGGMTLSIKQCHFLYQHCCAATGATVAKIDAENLLYLGSRDGFFNNDFHKRADLKVHIPLQSARMHRIVEEEQLSRKRMQSAPLTDIQLYSYGSVRRARH